MSDYISREAAIELVRKIADGYNYVEVPTEHLVRYIQSIPAAYVVEVVRCKDCKYGSCTGAYGKYYECELSEGELAPLWREDDFCSYGERREDGGEDE
ncbi:MAG: hypothetical protein J5725_10320 [Bacteroidales bacterium]|nr:hypothetical protein [Bacteroidales bacterium]